MSTQTISGLISGFPHYSIAGDTVEFSAPTGCVLEKSHDLASWNDVSETSPFMHSGTPAHYRITRKTDDGLPVVVTINIDRKY